jgi:hypothetical protein
MTTERALYMRFTKGMDESERIDVQIPLEQFENEARDFNQHNIQEFLKSGLFSKEFI